MINLDFHIKEIDGVKYVPLDIVNQALKEVYEFEKQQNTLDEALKVLNDAFNDLNSITKELND